MKLPFQAESVIRSGNAHSASATVQPSCMAPNSQTCSNKQGSWCCNPTDMCGTTKGVCISG